MDRIPAKRLQFWLVAIPLAAAIFGLVWIEKNQWEEVTDSQPVSKRRMADHVETSLSRRGIASIPTPGNSIPERRWRLFPEGTVEGEVVLTFDTQTELRAFLKRAREAGVRSIDVLHDLNSVRVPAEVLDSGDAGESTVDFNYVVSVPTMPAPRSSDGTKYAAFGTDAVQWLGGADVSARWGEGIKIAILDTGVDPATPVAARLAGVIDATGGSSSNHTGHGTAIATLLLGEEGRVTGIAPKADVISVQVVAEEGSGDSFSLARGIIAAVDQGAKVLSISLGSYGDSNVVRAAVEYAQSRGAVIVAAAGNEGRDSVVYPARYDGVIAVTAADAKGQVPYFGNRGVEVDVAAPGVGVVTRWDAESGISFTGTSAAVPFVSGAIAGLLSQEPYLPAAEAAQLVMDYSNDAGPPGFDSTNGAGILAIDRLINRRQPGIYSLAIADYFIDEAHATSAGVPVVISAQNRGTEPLFNILMQASVGGVPSQQMIGSLKVGETGSYTVIVPNGRETQVTAFAHSLVSGTVASPQMRIIKSANGLSK